MKAVRTFTVFVIRWLPILAAAALLVWDFWGTGPLHRHSQHEVLAASAKDGRLHVLSVTVAEGRTVEGVTFDGSRNVYRVRLSGNDSVSGAIVAKPPPLLSPTLGFDAQSFAAPTTGTLFRRTVIPAWPLIAGLIALPSSGLAVRYARRRRRKLQGRCVACGADLEGKRGSCPACGNVAPSTV
jgi:hypothetical protein